MKRVGGAYGSKITRPHQIAAACALGAHATRRPVRMHLDIDTNMKMVGKRFPYLAQYTVSLKCILSCALYGVSVPGWSYV